MSFNSGMIKVATKLIREFGGKGILHHNDMQIDPITGEETGVETTENVEYFREFYEDRELIENRIINGDAKASLVLDHPPETNWKLEDISGDVWDIISITPIETQDTVVLYELHIRK